MFDIKSILKVNSRKNFAGNQKYLEKTQNV